MKITETHLIPLYTEDSIHNGYIFSPPKVGEKNIPPIGDCPLTIKEFWLWMLAITLLSTLLIGKYFQV